MRFSGTESLESNERLHVKVDGYSSSCVVAARGGAGDGDGTVPVPGSLVYKRARNSNNLRSG